MRVFLIRHGAAEPRRHGTADSGRELTADGAQEVGRVARRLARLDLRFGRLLSSPLVRARQTAELLVGAGLAERAEECRELAPGGSFDAMVEILTTSRDRAEGSAALVGHEPMLSLWTELLVWGETAGRIALKKGGIVAVELPEAEPLPGNCTLVWLTSPKLL